MDGASIYTPAGKFKSRWKLSLFQMIKTKILSSLLQMIRFERLWLVPAALRLFLFLNDDEKQFIAEYY